MVIEPEADEPYCYKLYTYTQHYYPNVIYGYMYVVYIGQ